MSIGMKFYVALERPHSTAPFDIFRPKPFIPLNFTFNVHFIHTMFETDKRCTKNKREACSKTKKGHTKKISPSFHMLLLLLFHSVLFFPFLHTLFCVICHNHLAAHSLLYFSPTPSTLIMLFHTTHHSSSSPNSKHQVIFFSFSPNACVHITDSNGSVSLSFCCILCLFS